MKRIVIELPDDVAEQFASDAAARGSTIEDAAGDLVRELLCERMHAIRARREVLDDLAGSLEPDGPSVLHSTDVEAFLKKHWADDIAEGSGLDGSNR